MDAGEGAGKSAGEDVRFSTEEAYIGAKFFLRNL